MIDIFESDLNSLIVAEIEMAEKDKIYAFFSANSKQIYIDDTDLVEHLQRGKNEPINNTTLALLYEYMDN